MAVIYIFDQNEHLRRKRMPFVKRKSITLLNNIHVGEIEN